MTANSHFYAAQAEKCSREAADCQLPQQRATLERARLAWQSLAEREATIAAARDRRIAEAAARAAPDALTIGTPNRN